jgi:hypothetical protein
MKIPGPDEDVHVFVKEVKGHKHYLTFNMYTTLECPDFYNYFLCRMKSPNSKLSSYKHIFDKDILPHFELCYKILGDSDINPFMEQ